jgi:hypothetical protein
MVPERVSNGRAPLLRLIVTIAIGLIGVWLSP